MATDVAAGFPQVDLVPLCIITVTLDDPSAVITQMSVHGWQSDGAAGSLTAPPVDPAFFAGEAA